MTSFLKQAKKALEEELVNPHNFRARAEDDEKGKQDFAIARSKAVNFIEKLVMNKSTSEAWVIGVDFDRRK